MDSSGANGAAGRPTRRDVVIGTAAIGVLGVLGACATPEPSATSATSDSSGTSGTSAPSSDPLGTTPPATAASLEDGSYVPPANGEWEAADPAATGWDPAGLEAVTAFVGENNSRTFLMLAGGRILAEQYWSGATTDAVQDIASCQKSIVSTLVGISRDRGELTLDDPVTDHLGAGWSKAAPGEEARITIRHLLTMTSGLSSNTLAMQAEPGTVWGYNTPAYQKLRPVLEAATGEDIATLSRTRMFDAIGIGASALWISRGNGPGSVDATGAQLWGLRLTAHDMARFGLLAQRRGQWGATQVVPDDWFTEAWAPLDLKDDYGYLWWLLGRSRGGGTGPAAPKDFVAALGALDQKIYVVPSLDLVVVRQGLAAGQASENTSDFDAALYRAIAAAR